MRVLACVLAAFVVCVPAAGATPPGLKLLVRDGSKLAVIYVDRVTPFVQPLHAAPWRPLAFSGDGRLISIGGTILGRATFPTRQLSWAPTGERAAFTTTDGSVVVWTPAGRRRIEPKGWGAGRYLPALAWSQDGALAISRGSELWVWRSGAAHRVVAAPEGLPVPAAWTSDGHLLWWVWPDSSSIAADGVALYEDETRIGTTLMYRDYLDACGTHVAFVSGGDRSSSHDKSIVFDGRDVSQDPALSWVSPSCTVDGHRLVAAAGRDLGICCRKARELRSIWQLLPERRRLTQPPAGWTDESPHVFPNGDVLFVRSRLTSKRSGNTWLDTERGLVMLLSQGTLRQVATVGYTNLDELKLFIGPYYDHYDWSQLLAVAS